MPQDDDGYLVEFQQLGNAVKVTAVDPATGTEASIVGDPRAGEAVLARTAVRKLKYLLSKRTGSVPPSTNGGRGHLV